MLVEGIVNHLLSESTDYDVLLADGRRLAPKALFGVAASRALNLDVRPGHFRGGEGTPRFRAIRAAEFRIVPKAAEGDVPAPPEERNWIEGGPMRGWHLRYERNPGAAREKSKHSRKATAAAGMQTMVVWSPQNCCRNLGETPASKSHHKFRWRN